MAIKDLTGQRFGRLTVISFAGVNKQGNSTWLCRCDCGNEKIVARGNLTSGTTTSCGCYQKELTRNRSTTHGYSNERLFGIWKMMIQRCTNPNNAKYPYYGGNGIKVCDEWLNSFEVFRGWALANGYADNLTIDRKDNKRGYFPENCRWVTPKEQANNTTRNLVLTINGKTQTLALHVEDPEINVYGQDYYTVRARIYKLGWTLEESFSIPLRGKYTRQGAI